MDYESMKGAAFTIAAMVVISTGWTAEEPSVALSGVKARMLNRPQIDYPYYARDRRWQGAGWYIMHLNQKTGTVKAVEVYKSTGYKILDDAVIRALMTARFQPGLKSVRMPATFTMRKPAKVKPPPYPASPSPFPRNTDIGP